VLLGRLVCRVHLGDRGSPGHHAYSIRLVRPNCRTSQNRQTPLARSCCRAGSGCLACLDRQTQPNSRAQLDPQARLDSRACSSCWARSGRRIRSGRLTCLGHRARLGRRASWGRWVGQGH